MPDPITADAGKPASVNEALRILATKERWHFQDLPDCIRDASLLRRLAHEGYIVGQNNSTLKVRALTCNMVGDRATLPESFAITEPAFNLRDTWQSPKKWDWVVCVRSVRAGNAIGPDIRLSNSGWVKSEDLRQNPRKGVAAAGGKPRKSPKNVNRRKPTKRTMPTERELTALELKSQGHSLREIANSMGVHKSRAGQLLNSAKKRPQAPSRSVDLSKAVPLIDHDGVAPKSKKKSRLLNHD